MYHIVAIDYQDLRIIDIPYYKVGFRDQHYEVFFDCTDVVCTQCADNDKWSHQRRSRKRHANEVESDVGNTASGSKEFVVIDKSGTISHMININITKMAKHGNVSINNAWKKVRLLRLQLPSM